MVPKTRPTRWKFNSLTPPRLHVRNRHRQRRRNRSRRCIPPQTRNITNLQALLYHTFAALAENTRSEMTVAYRHLMGIGTPRSCEDAVHYYKSVADKCTPLGPLPFPTLNPSTNLPPPAIHFFR